MRNNSKIWVFQKGNSFKRLDTKGLQSDPEWKNYRYALNSNNLKVLQDSMQIRDMKFPQRIAMLSQIISENGGNTTPHGNGAYGLVGWRGGREAGLGNSLPKQIHRLMDDTYNSTRSKEWNHGGKGTGVQSGAEMQKLFRDTPNTMQATKAFMKGYVRPPKDQMQRRLQLSNLLKKHMK